MTDERQARARILGIAMVHASVVLFGACEQTPYIHTDYEQRIDVPVVPVERQREPEVRALPPAWVLAPMRTELRDQVGRIIYEPPPYLGLVALADTIVRPSGAQQAGAGREPAAGAQAEPATVIGGRGTRTPGGEGGAARQRRPAEPAAGQLEDTARARRDTTRQP